MVANAANQVEGLNYHETFLLVTKATSIRILLTIAITKAISAMPSLMKDWRSIFSCNSPRDSSTRIIHPTFVCSTDLFTTSSSCPKLVLSPKGFSYFRWVCQEPGRCFALHLWRRSCSVRPSLHGRHGRHDRHKLGSIKGRRIDVGHGWWVRHSCSRQIELLPRHPSTTMWGLCFSWAIIVLGQLATQLWVQQSQSDTLTDGIQTRSNTETINNAANYHQIIKSLQYLVLTRPDIGFVVSKLSYYPNMLSILSKCTGVHWRGHYGICPDLTLLGIIYRRSASSLSMPFVIPTRAATSWTGRVSTASWFTLGIGIWDHSYHLEL